MKERTKNSKSMSNKNKIPKKEIELVHKFINYKEIEKIKSKQNKISSKKLLNNKFAPIKVRLTPLNKRHNSKGKKNNIQKSNTLTENNFNFNKSLYLSPSHRLNTETDNCIPNKLSKKNYSETRNDIKEIKLNRNCTTPYKRILNNKYEDEFSPSTSVIIKNFNYNNVYNFNIDNDRIQNQKVGLNNKLINKNNEGTYNDVSNTSSSNFTYNKPKTSTGITSSCISTKNKNSENFFSSFTNDRRKLNEKRNNILCDDLGFNVPKLDLRQNIKNNFTRNQLLNNNCKTNKKMININDYNSASKKLNKNRKANITETNNFNNSNSQTKYNSFSDINLKAKIVNKFYNTSSISLKYNYNKTKENINSLKDFNKYNIKTEPKIDDFEFDSYTQEQNTEIGFNLNDLFIFEDRINDIISAFNNRNNIYDNEASNECNEFMNFYSKSSLKGIFASFFKKKKSTYN